MAVLLVIQRPVAVVSKLVEAICIYGAVGERGALFADIVTHSTVQCCAVGERGARLIIAKTISICC